MRHLTLMRSQIDSENIDIDNRCFEIWKSVYQQDVDSRGAMLNPDDYRRAEIVSIILNSDNDIVGFNCINRWDRRLLADQHHSYVRNIPVEALDKITEGGIQPIFHSLEWLTVNPKYRRSLAKVSLGEILISLSGLIVSTYQTAGIIGTARKDLRVDEIAKRVGFEFVCDVTRLQNECALVFLPKGRLLEPADIKTRLVINELVGQGRSMSA